MYGYGIMGFTKFVFPSRKRGCVGVVYGLTLALAGSGSGLGLLWISLPLFAFLSVFFVFFAVYKGTR